MYMEKTLSMQNLDEFDFEETKRNIVNYFYVLEKLEWEWLKLNTQKGLSANYDYGTEYRKQPYIPIGKDIFGLSAKDRKEEELKRYISTYYWAKSTLTEKEQIYIVECFVNHKGEKEIVDILDLDRTDSNEFRNLKRSAVYKFADFLDLVERKQKEYGGMSL